MQEQETKKFIPTLILIIALIILAGVFAFLKFKPKKIIKPFENFTLDSFDKLEISHNNQNYILIKQGDNWFVDNFKVKHEYLNNLLEDLILVEIAESVSENPEKHSVLEIDILSGVEIKIFNQDKKISHFWVGKNGPIYPSSYFRWNEKDEVYLVRSFLRQRAGLPDWRDLAIINVDSNIINKISWTRKNISQEIIKTETGWTKNGEEVEQESVDSILENLSPLNADDAFLNKEVDLQNPDLVLDIQTEDNTDYKLLFIKQEDGKFYVILNNGNIIYQMDKYIPENLLNFVDKL